MGEWTMKAVAENMRDIDFGMLTTRTEGGGYASRPMSNNGEVKYDGDSYFFSYDTARTISDIEWSSQVGLTFNGKPGALGKPPFFPSDRWHCAHTRQGRVPEPLGRRSPTLVRAGHRLSQPRPH